jgi:hypothetical protein
MIMVLSHGENLSARSAVTVIGGLLSSAIAFILAQFSILFIEFYFVRFGSLADISQC